MLKEPWRARVEDLQEGDQLQFWCARCGHTGNVPARVFLDRARRRKATNWHRVQLYTPVKELRAYVYCHRCPKGSKGHRHRDFDMHIWQSANWKPEGVFSLYQKVSG